MRKINRKNIVPQILSYQDSKKINDDILHIDYLNFKVIFWEILTINEKGHPIADYITVNEAEANGIDKSKLLGESVRNMIKRYPSNIRLFQSFLEDFLEDNYASPDMYVMLNKWTYGATAMLDIESLNTFCHELKCKKVFILPCSIYEVILLPDEKVSSNYLFDIVKGANKIIKTEDKLSDSVYGYCLDDNSLYVEATCTLIGG